MMADLVHESAAHCKKNSYFCQPITTTGYSYLLENNFNGYACSPCSHNGRQIRLRARLPDTHQKVPIIRQWPLHLPRWIEWSVRTLANRTEISHSQHPYDPRWRTSTSCHRHRTHMPAQRTVCRTWRWRPRFHSSRAWQTGQPPLSTPVLSPLDDKSTELRKPCPKRVSISRDTEEGFANHFRHEESPFTW